MIFWFFCIFWFFDFFVFLIFSRKRDCGGSVEGGGWGWDGNGRVAPKSRARRNYQGRSSGSPAGHTLHPEGCEPPGIPGRASSKPCNRLPGLTGSPLQDLLGTPVSACVGLQRYRMSSTACAPNSCGDRGRHRSSRNTCGSWVKLLHIARFHTWMTSRTDGNHKSPCCVPSIHRMNTHGMPYLIAWIWNWVAGYILRIVTKSLIKFNFQWLTLPQRISLDFHKKLVLSYSFCLSIIFSFDYFFGFLSIYIFAPTYR